jgi:protein-disulfide isomerase
VHPYALTAALAAEATTPHGVFWEMHDLLFRQQNRLTDADLARYAESLGVDGSLVVGEAAQPYGDVVEADFAEGVEQGVPGTPTLFIDGRLYEGPLELAALRQATSGSAGRLAPRAWWQRR